MVLDIHRQIIIKKIQVNEVDHPCLESTISIKLFLQINHESKN
jgi:hypothetical protein